MGCKTARLQASPAPEAAPAMEAYSGRPACGPAPCLDAGGMSRPPRAPNDPGRRSNAELKACLDPTLMLAMSGIALRSEERRLVARNCGGNAAPGCPSAVDWRPNGRSSTGLEYRSDGFGRDCRWATTATRMRPAIKVVQGAVFEVTGPAWAGAPARYTQPAKSRWGGGES